MRSRAAMDGRSVPVARYMSLTVNFYEGFTYAGTGCLLRKLGLGSQELAERTQNFNNFASDYQVEDLSTKPAAFGADLSGSLGFAIVKGAEVSGWQPAEANAAATKQCP